MDRERNLLVVLENHAYGDGTLGTGPDLTERFARWFQNQDLKNVLTDQAVPSSRLAEIPPEALLRVA